jgi:hypothetical protein
LRHCPERSLPMAFKEFLINAYHNGHRLNFDVNQYPAWYRQLMIECYALLPARPATYCESHCSDIRAKWSCLSPGSGVRKYTLTRTLTHQPCQ